MGKKEGFHKEDFPE